MEIRPATPGDSQALTALAFRAKARWGYPAEWMDEWRAELTLGAGYLDAHQGFVVVEKGTPIAVCILEDHGASFRLEHFWVDPAAQGKGVGERLLRHVLDAARKQRGGPCDILADPHAEAFYVRYGARRIGTVPGPMPGEPDRTLPLLRFANCQMTTPAGQPG